MAKTLLEQAKAVQVKGAERKGADLNVEELDLMLALAHGDVKRQQVAVALGIRPSSVEGRCGMVFVKAVKAGVLHPESLAGSTPW